MNVRKALAAWAVAATLLIGGGPAFADAFPWAEDREERNEREADLYENGTDAIDDEEWDDAVRAFKAVAEMNGSRADGALYWMAYALNKAGRRAEAVQAIEGLKKNFRKEAIHLLGIMGGRAELHSLYAGETSAEVRKQIIQGLFLSNDGDRLADLARGEKDPQLRREAIRKLGLIGGKTAPTLLALYGSETNVETKKAIIEAFFLQNNARALIDLSKKETNPQLRKAALQKLSMMGNDEALAYMLQILEE